MNIVDLQNRSNKIFKVIKDFQYLFPDEFEKCGIVSCGHCNGTGLTKADLQTLCTNCGGMCYVGFKKLCGNFVCRTCNGYGCYKCNNKGTVDWITHANGRDYPGSMKK